MTLKSDAQMAKKLQEAFDQEAAGMFAQPQAGNIAYPLPHPHPQPIHMPNPFQTCIQKVCSMVSDREARGLADKYGLNILNITWEDNARNKNSSWGPCISVRDVTLIAL